ncbi:MAG: glycosyltransferase [Deltaproteobacteria bacterium]|nr:glycosyltransferase [Deltaproteobacteria bacterium]
MEQRPQLTVIVPVYDEVLTVAELLARVRRVPLRKQILVVDDGSTDGSDRRLRQVKKSWEEDPDELTTLELFTHEENRGKGAAIRTAIPHARGEITLIQDADLEYDPREYETLIRPILEGRADVVYGSRFAGESRRVLYYWHSLGNRALTTMSNMLTDLNLTDMETCYKAFRTSVLQEIPLREDRFGFEPEITAKIARLGLRIFEVPISYHGRTYSEGKKIDWRDGVEAGRVMLHHWLKDEVSDSQVGRRTLEIMRRTGRYNDWLFEQLRPHLGLRVVEVGSGIGNISRKMLDRDRLVVTDIDEESLEVLRVEFGDFEQVDVCYFDLGAEIPAEVRDARPDTVVCCNVLEHVLDDRAALERIHEALVPGGKLLLLVPAHGFAYGGLDEALDHHRRYDRGGLEALLREVGYEIDSTVSLNLLGLAGWFVNGKVLGRRLIPRNQARLIDRLVPYLEAERRLHLPWGLSLLTVARKAWQGRD